MKETDYSKITTEQLEFMLPLDFQRAEKRERMCADCPPKEEVKHIRYEQILWRSDNYFGHEDKKSRQYEIYCREDKWVGKLPLFSTGRKHSFREALIEMHKTLTREGIIKEEDTHQSRKECA